MPKPSERSLIVGGLFFFAFWLFVALPFFYTVPRYSHDEAANKCSTEESKNHGFWEKAGCDPTAYFTLWLVAFTGVLAVSTIGLGAATIGLYLTGEKQARLAAEGFASQSRDMQASIKAATAANKVAEKALIATDRAWISIKAEIIAPLVFGREEILLGVGLNLTNVGKSPATHLEITGAFCCDIIEAREKASAAANSTRYSLLDVGVILFPGETEEKDWSKLEMPAEVFRGNIAEAKIRAKQENDPDWDGSTANPAIMVCARYSLPGSVQRHHTIILFEVVHTDKAHLGWDGSEGKTDLVYLRLVQTLLSGQVT